MCNCTGIHVAPITGDNALLVGGFKIVIEVITAGDDLPAVVYRAYRKGLHIASFTSIQEAVEWCQ